MYVYELRRQVMRDIPDNADLGDLFSIIDDAQEDFQLSKPWNFYQKKSTITLITPYNTGTVTVTEDSTTVTGDGTTWTSAMTGRQIKFEAQSAVYDVTFVSTTELTLDRNYTEDTEAGKDYSIYQSIYDLPSDFNRVIHLQNARTSQFLDSVPVRDQLYDVAASVNTTDSRAYALWGQNGALRQIRLLYGPLEADVLSVFYMRTTANVDNMDDSIDVPIGAEAIIKHAVIIRILARMLLNAGDGAQGIATSIGVAKAEKAIALRKVWSRDVQESQVRRRNERLLV